MGGLRGARLTPAHNPLAPAPPLKLAKIKNMKFCSFILSFAFHILLCEGDISHRGRKKLRELTSKGIQVAGLILPHISLLLAFTALQVLRFLGGIVKRF